jgi:hypothetical protein
MTGESSRRRVMHTHAIRALLLGADDGLTTGEMARTLGVTASYVNGILNDAYGFYVDRWADSGSRISAVWACVPVPKNCPRPDPRPEGEQAEIYALNKELEY